MEETQYTQVTAVGPSATHVTVNTNREEDTKTVTKSTFASTYYEESNSKPAGRLKSDFSRFKTRKWILRMATWNVKTLYQPGKLDNLLQEMKNMNVDIMEISEVRWNDAGQFVKDNFIMVYSGNDSHTNGVGGIMKKEIYKSMIGWWPINDRIMMIKISAQPFNINIIQLYAPNSTHKDEEIEELYDKIQRVLQNVKSDEIIIIMGDLSAKIGEGIQGDVVGPFGLGEINERGSQTDTVLHPKLFRHNEHLLRTSKRTILYLEKSQ